MVKMANFMLCVYFITIKKVSFNGKKNTGHKAKLCPRPGLTVDPGIRAPRPLLPPMRRNAPSTGPPSS